MRKTLVLSGIKHCGKTTLGNMLADRRGCAWYDLDQLVMNRPSANHYPTLRDFYRAEGVERFQELETESLKDILERFNPGTKQAVISLGGGTVENEEAMTLLQKEGNIVYLYVPEEVLYERIMAGGRPPFLSVETPREDFHEIYRRRDEMNRKIADLVIDLNEAPPEENLQIIWDFISKSE
ncbi:MAG: shikimate kinase [Spirochaetales bacterium]|nr:shikimate kinase [Spirochaetales bacterium]